MAVRFSTDDISRGALSEEQVEADGPDLQTSLSVLAGLVADTTQLTPTRPSNAY